MKKWKGLKYRTLKWCKGQKQSVLNVTNCMGKHGIAVSDFSIRSN